MIIIAQIVLASDEEMWILISYWVVLKNFEGKFPVSQHGFPVTHENSWISGYFEFLNFRDAIIFGLKVAIIFLLFLKIFIQKRPVTSGFSICKSWNLVFLNIFHILRRKLHYQSKIASIKLSNLLDSHWNAQKS